LPRSHLSRHLPPLPTRRSSDLERRYTGHPTAEDFTHVFLNEPALEPGFDVARCVVGAALRGGQHPAELLPSGFFFFVRRQRHGRSEEHTSELQSRESLVCRLLL